MIKGDGNVYSSSSHPYPCLGEFKSGVGHWNAVSVNVRGSSTLSARIKSMSTDTEDELKKTECDPLSTRHSSVGKG